MKSRIEVEVATNRVLRIINSKQRSEPFVIMKF
jgi:hypothetical protein